MYKSRLALAVSGALLLSACGGGDGGDSSPTNPPVEIPTPAPTSLDVTVIDGYLGEAKVWLDKKDASGDLNYQLDAGELSGTTDNNGAFTFDLTVLEGELSDYQVVAKAIAGVSTDKDLDDKTINKDLLMTAYEGGVVTPLTTLVEAKVRELKTTSVAIAADLYEQAVQEVATDLGVSPDAVTSDYKQSNDEESLKVAQSAVSLVESGVVPSDTTEIQDTATIEKQSKAINDVVKDTPVEQIVVDADPTDDDAPVPVENKDTDGDGFIDDLDAFPNDADEWYDSDGDGDGDNTDTDDDGDTVLDKDDAFPLDPSEHTDTDLDGIGNEADLDDDNDGLSDVEEDDLGTNPLLKDSDLDGIEDADELELGTDPKNDDTDSDGLLDGEEVDLGTDPKSDDTDNDGLLDGEEVDLGTDPKSDDTDNDGLLDGEEVDLGTDPKSDDTDNDGLLDGEEVDLGTDPKLDDTDSDGLKDGEEIDLGTDPKSGDTDKDGTGDKDDAFPTDPNETTDTDGDGIGDNSDPDIDGDGYDNEVDNEPLIPLEHPATFAQCVDTLPSQLELTDATGRDNAAYYTIERENYDYDWDTNTGQWANIAYTQTEMFVGTRLGMHKGLHPSKTFDVYAVVPHMGGIDEWSDRADLEYYDQAGKHFYGNHDTFYGWYGLHTNDKGGELVLNLNEPLITDYERVDAWNPNPASPTSAPESVINTYSGRKIINYKGQLVEACVSGHTIDKIAYIAGDKSVDHNDDLYISEKHTNYTVEQNLVIRSEREYLEYSDEEMTHQIGGFQNYVKELDAAITNGLQLSADPLTVQALAEGQPATLEQCLAELPEAQNPVNSAYSLVYDVDRNYKDSSYEYYQYTWVPFAELLASWTDASGNVHQNVQKTEFTGADVDGVIKFEETGFSDENEKGIAWYGYDKDTDNNGVIEPGVDAISWGSTNRLDEQEGYETGNYYRVPSMSYGRSDVASPGADWDYSEHAYSRVYMGKAMVIDGKGNSVNTCRTWSRTEERFYDVNDTRLFNESKIEHNYFDNDGIVLRERETEFDNQTWKRKAVNAPAPL